MFLPKYLISIKLNLEKNFEKIKQIFLENLKKDLIQLSRNSIQSIKDPSIAPPEESIGEDSISDPPLPRLGVIPANRGKNTSSRTEDSARSRTTVT